MNVYVSPGSTGDSPNKRRAERVRAARLRISLTGITAAVVLFVAVQLGVAGVWLTAGVAAVMVIAIAVAA